MDQAAAKHTTSSVDLESTVYAALQEFYLMEVLALYRLEPAIRKSGMNQNAL